MCRATIAAMMCSAAGLKEYFEALGAAFDGCVVMTSRGRRWQTAYLPLAEAAAEKLRKEQAQLILIVEGHVYYPPRAAAASSDMGPMRSVFMQVFKVPVIAVPEDKPL